MRILSVADDAIELLSAIDDELFTVVFFSPHCFAVPRRTLVSLIYEDFAAGERDIEVWLGGLSEEWRTQCAAEGRTALADEEIVGCSDAPISGESAT